MARKFESPVMSDKTLLVSIEDLINIAMGSPTKNKVNYKLIQTVLHILASQLRMLEQRVEIQITDQAPDTPVRTAPKSPRKVETSTTDSYSGQSTLQSVKERKKEEARRHAEKAERAATKDMELRAKAAQRDQEKASRAASRERKKEEKFVEKEAEKEERAASKDRQKAAKEEQKDEWDVSIEKERVMRSVETDQKKKGRTTSKEREKYENAREKSTREQEREEKAVDQNVIYKQDKKDLGNAMKEKDEAVKTTRKERERIEKDQKKTIVEVNERAKTDKGKIHKESVTSIGIKDARSSGSIEVVTRSQFEVLAAWVEELAVKAGPLPLPALPDNEKLRAELAKGTASLTDTMAAMQVSARVQAAEQAVSRMADLLTQLVAAGALPEDIAAKVDYVTQHMDLSGAAASEIDEKPHILSKMKAPETAVTPIKLVTTTGSGARSVLSGVSISSGMTGPVTRSEMETALRNLREECKQTVHHITAKTVAAADTAANVAKSVDDKMNTAMQLDSRISKLHSLTTDYAGQLSGLDVGLATQMQGFQEQMAQMRSDLSQGLAQLELVNNNAETAAVTELTERYEGLVSELEQSLHSHSELTGRQRQLADELHALMEGVEMLREQKADRDEVQDGLRDKADNSRLAGLLSERAFEEARGELEKRLEHCHEKFRRQESAWMDAVKDISETMSTKVKLVELMRLRDDAQQLLKELNDRCTLLAEALGDPKAALLTRLMSRGAVCGACQAPALMEPVDASSGTPAALPAMRPRGLLEASDEPCLSERRVAAAADDRSHACRRWVGGSHTLLSPATARQRAGPTEGPPMPTAKYTGYGDDGRMYLMEEKLVPCVECNPLCDGDSGLKDGPHPSEDGAGDRPLTTEVTPPDPVSKESAV